MNILLTGASGLLGHHLLATADRKDELFSARININDRDAVRSAMAYCKPEMVIHCAAEGRVDFAEQNPVSAWDTNVAGTQNLLMSAKVYKSHFVFMSTNAVYDGFAPPYHEHSRQNPINRYGVTKRDAEDLVECYPHRVTVIRPIMLYGYPKGNGRGNFVTRTLADLMRDTEIRVADDIITQPTYALDAAEAIWKILQMPEKDTQYVNLAPRETMSLFKFAREIAKVWELDDRLITPAKAMDFTGLAPRPLDTTYDVRKLDRLGIALKPAEQGLREMKKEFP